MIVKSEEHMGIKTTTLHTTKGKLLLFTGRQWQVIKNNMILAEFDRYEKAYGYAKQYLEMGLVS